MHQSSIELTIEGAHSASWLHVSSAMGRTVHVLAVGRLVGARSALVGARLTLLALIRRVRGDICRAVRLRASQERQGKRDKAQREREWHFGGGGI